MASIMVILPLQFSNSREFPKLEVSLMFHILDKCRRLRLLCGRLMKIQGLLNWVMMYTPFLLYPFSQGIQWNLLARVIFWQTFQFIHIFALFQSGLIATCENLFNHATCTMLAHNIFLTYDIQLNATTIELNNLLWHATMQWHYIWHHVMSFKCHATLCYIMLKLAMTFWTNILCDNDV